MHWILQYLPQLSEMHMQSTRCICGLLLLGLFALPGCRIIGGFDVAEPTPNADLTDASDMASSDANMDPEDLSTPADSGAEEMPPACAERETRCDGSDDNCDGTIDEGCDDDGDGFCDLSLTYAPGATCIEGDCDDTREDIFPGATEPCLAGEDLDCDGKLRSYRTDLTPIQPIIAPGALGEISFPNMRPGPERSFGLFWIEERELNPALRFQRINELGTTEGEVVTLTMPDENVLIHEALWHDASASWVVLWRSYAEDGQGNVYRLNRYDRDGVALGERKTVHRTDSFSGFYSYLANAHLVEAGEDVLLLYSASDGGVFDVHAATYSPSTHELHASERIYGDKFTYELSWAYLEPEGPMQQGVVVFKESGGLKTPPRFENGAEFLSLEVEPELSPQRKTSFFGSDYAHDQVIKTGANTLAVTSYIDRANTPMNGRDYRLYIDALDEDFRPVGGVENRTLISERASSLHDVIEIDDARIGIHYDEAPSAQETIQRLAILDRRTLEILSDMELGLSTPSGHARLWLHYRGEDAMASSRYYALYRKTGDLVASELRHKLLIFNDQGVELTRTGLFPNVDTRTPFYIPSGVRSQRITEDGTFEWLTVINERDPATAEIIRKLTRSRILPDGSTEGPEVFEPPIVNNICNATFVGDTPVCAWIERTTLREDLTSNRVTGCEARLDFYVGEEGGQLERTSFDVPALLYDNNGSPACRFPWLNSYHVGKTTEGSWRVLVHEVDGFVDNTNVVTGDVVIYTLSPDGRFARDVLLEQMSHHQLRVYESGDKHVLVLLTGAEGIRLGYSVVDLSQPITTAEFQTIETPAPSLEQISGEQPYAINLSYALGGTLPGADPWLVFGVTKEDEFELFAQNIPLSGSREETSPVELGEVTLDSDETGYPYFFSAGHGVIMASVGTQNTQAESARVMAVSFDAASGEVLMPLTEFKDTEETFQQYPTTWTHPTRPHGMLLSTDPSNQRVWVISDEGEVLQEIDLPLSSLTSTLGNNTPPQGFAVYTLPDGTVRWPIWHGISNVTGRSLIVDMTCE